MLLLRESTPKTNMQAHKNYSKSTKTKILLCSPSLATRFGFENDVLHVFNILLVWESRKWYSRRDSNFCTRTIASNLSSVASGLCKWTTCTSDMAFFTIPLEGFLRNSYSLEFHKVFDWKGWYSCAAL